MKLRAIRRKGRSEVDYLEIPEEGDLERLHLRWLIAGIAADPKLLFGEAGEKLRAYARDKKGENE